MILAIDSTRDTQTYKVYQQETHCRTYIRVLRTMDPPTCTTKTQTFRATSAAGEAPACLLERRFESEFSFNNCAADSGVPSMTKFGAEHSPAENERTRELGEHRPCRHAELTFARPRGNAFLLAPQT
ncbi:hypothetical protein MRX96_023500 [Rhipicephalus microplus]